MSFNRWTLTQRILRQFIQRTMISKKTVHKNTAVVQCDTSSEQLYTNDNQIDILTANVGLHYEGS